MNLANYVTRVQPKFAGKWSTHSIWEKFNKAKKAIRDAYSKATGSGISETTVEEIPAAALKIQALPKSSTIYYKLLKGYTRKVEGFTRAHYQMFARQASWGRVPNIHFRQDFLWRRMKTGYLASFATLFLAQEERAEEASCQEKRMREYELICNNIKDIFGSSGAYEGSSVDAKDLGHSLSDYVLGQCIGVGSNGAVYDAEVVKKGSEDSAETPGGVKPMSAPKRRKVAIKMIFNYDSSKAGEVWRATKAEMITCGRGAINSKNWQNGCLDKMKKLPPHPNIIKVHRAIFEKVPLHPEFLIQHPAALPMPAGYGRSSAMFLVMERYDGTLQDFMKNRRFNYEILNILALQLLYGISHLEKNNVAHRDLKPNNILVKTDSNGFPRLVISDFGCAITADQNKDLRFPFNEQWDIRNGAPDIQPPEILNYKSGRDSLLDYRKSDAWAVGAILTGMFGIENSMTKTKALNNGYGNRFVHNLIKLLMKHDPNEVQYTLNMLKSDYISINSLLLADLLLRSCHGTSSSTLWTQVRREVVHEHTNGRYSQELATHARLRDTGLQVYKLGKGFCCC